MVRTGALKRYRYVTIQTLKADTGTLSLSSSQGLDWFVAKTAATTIPDGHRPTTWAKLLL